MAEVQRVDKKSTIKWVPINLMRVSAQAQRERKQYKVDNIVANFDAEQLGVPVVNKRDGFYYVIDGQHRVDACIQRGWDDQQLQCEVYEGLSEREEANMFLQRNDSLVVGVMDKYKVGVVAGRKDAVDIDKMTRSLGLKVGMDKSNGTVKAVGTLRKIYERSGSEVLKTTLWLINETYGDSGFGAVTIDGLSMLVDRYGSTIDYEYFITRLGSYKGGVNGLLGNAEVLRRQMGQAKGQCVAAAAVTIYNQGKHPGIKNLRSWWRADDEE